MGLSALLVPGLHWRTFGPQLGFEHAMQNASTEQESTACPREFTPSSLAKILSSTRARAPCHAGLLQNYDLSQDSVVKFIPQAHSTLEMKKMLIHYIDIFSDS